MASPERQLEEKLIQKLVSLKYEYRQDIRDRAELALGDDRHPLLTERAQGRDISGLSAYEQK